jgi:hypothetical protein
VRQLTAVFTHNRQGINRSGQPHAGHPGTPPHHRAGGAERRGPRRSAHRQSRTPRGTAQLPADPTGRGVARPGDRVAGHRTAALGGGVDPHPAHRVLPYRAGRPTVCAVVAARPAGLGRGEAAALRWTDLDLDHAEHNAKVVPDATQPCDSSTPSRRYRVTRSLPVAIPRRRRPPPVPGSSPIVRRRGRVFDGVRDGRIVVSRSVAGGEIGGAAA